MNADALRDAITKEMMDYRCPKLLCTSQASYILQPVANTSCSDGFSSSDCSRVKHQLATDSAVTDTSSQSKSSVCVESATSSDIVGSADGKVIPEVPGISAAKAELDGNSVEMPSASTCPRIEVHPHDVTMLSARSVIVDGDVKLKDEITAINSCSDQTDTTTTVKDNQTDITASQSSSSALVVNTDLPQTADAKARIKAALLNSGRRRQRLGQFTDRNSTSCLCLSLSLFFISICVFVSVSVCLYLFSLSMSVSLSLSLSVFISFLCLCLCLCVCLCLCRPVFISFLCLYLCLSVFVSVVISVSVSSPVSLWLPLFFSLWDMIWRLSDCLACYNRLTVQYKFTYLLFSYSVSVFFLSLSLSVFIPVSISVSSVCLCLPLYRCLYLCVYFIVCLCRSRYLILCLISALSLFPFMSLSRFISSSLSVSAFSNWISWAGSQDEWSPQCRWKK